MRRLGSAALGIGAFGLAPLLISVASILAVPVMLHALGERVWLSVAIGQAAGELGRAVTIWGWNSVGLAVVSSLTPTERIAYYFRSVPARCLLCCGCLLLVAVSAFLMPVASSPTYALMATAGTILGLSGSWAFIGGREPRHLILLDALPRSASIGLGIVGLLLWPRAEVFACCVIFGNLVAVVGPWLVFRGRRRRSDLPTVRQSSSEVLSSIRAGFSPFVIGFVLTARMSLPVLLSPIIAPASAPVVALADKFMRWGNTAMTPIMQYTQTGIPRASGELHEKVRKGTRITMVIGALIGAIAIPTVLLLSPLVSAGRIHLSPAISILVGGVLALIFVCSVTGNASLVLLGRTGTVARGAVVGLAMMCSLIVPAGHLWGAVGILLTYVTAEGGIFIFQMILLRRSLAEARTTSGSSRPHEAGEPPHNQDKELSREDTP